MVLAAGLGTRLWPLTADRAKPAVPFLGRPLVAGIVDLLGRHGVERAVVNTHHRPESIHRALEAPAGGAGGVRIAFSHEPAILGTAGALAKAREDRALDRDDTTLVINAKLFTDIDLSIAIRAHCASGAAVTMVLRPNFEREHFREVIVRSDRVVGFGEGRAPKGESPLLFTGIHLIEPEVLAGIPLRECDTVSDIYPPLIEAGRVAAHLDQGRWWEFSTLERYLELHQRAYEEGLGPAVSCSSGASVDPAARVTRSVLWEGAEVRAGAEVDNAVLGAGVIVAEGERIRDAVIVRRDVLGGISDPDRADGETLSRDRVLVRLAR